MRDAHFRRVAIMLGNSTLSLLVRDTGIEPVTSSVSGKRSPAELIARVIFGGGDGNRTRVHGFAGRCLTTRPLHRRSDAFRADDGIRTRDPHLGKVMRYQLRYIREPRARSSPVAKPDNSPPWSTRKMVGRLASEPHSAQTAGHVNLRPRQVAIAGCARRSRGSVGERPLHTRKVAGSIPAGTTTNPLLDGFFRIFDAVPPAKPDPIRYRRF
jgi:hypothetical protein